jgi:hypothetical protein
MDAHERQPLWGQGQKNYAGGSVRPLLLHPQQRTSTDGSDPLNLCAINGPEHLQQLEACEGVQNATRALVSEGGLPLMARVIQLLHQLGTAALAGQSDRALWLF